MATHQSPPTQSSSRWSIVYFVGMLLVFVGERLIGSGSGRGLTVVGVLAVGLALAMRVSRAAQAEGESRRIERAFLGVYAAGALGLLFYFVQSDLAAGLLGDKPLDKEWPRLAGVLGALYPALITLSLVPSLLGELAYASVARAPKLEALRIQDAILSGVGLACAVVFAFSFAYIASERDKKMDLSYFRTARPGESTRKIVRTLDQPIQVSMFFPPANEVREEVKGYFDDLQKESNLLQVVAYDHAVDPAKAKELGVSGNGVVVISRGGRKEQMSVGLELEAARSQLRDLDKQVQKRFLQVAKPGRTVYLTSGHGERAAAPTSDTDKRLTVRDFRELLSQQGYAVKDLGAAEGLAADVPSDAAIVAVLGPQKPLLAEEAAALQRYVDRGGRVFLALDPETGLDEKELLGPLGLKLTPTLLANDQIYARRTYQQSDRANIATGSYSSHPSVTTLGRLGMKAPMVLLGAGWLEETKDKPKDLTIDFPVRAHPATWNDANGNFLFDAPAEQRKGWNLSAAVVKKKAGGKPTEEARVLVLADSDAVGDGIIVNPGNAYFVLDGMKWLIGDEAISGEVSSEVDVPVAHTKKQDQIWFYSTIFLAPGLVLAIGAWVMRRRRPTDAAKKEAA
jgi:hypothetical protein